jgi:integrase/recombinase XerD
MNDLVILPASKQPALPAVFQSSPDGERRFWEFFTVNIRNPHTRRAYFNAVSAFAAWCEEKHLYHLAAVTPMHVAAYVEQLGRTHSKPTVKQHLAAVRMLFDWLVTGQVVPANPAHAVRGPKHSVKKGKTPVLEADEMRELLASIDTGTLLGLRDRALIGLMGYTFARVSAAVGMTVKDYYVQKRRGWVRLHEKGGKEHDVPCHHTLEQYLDEYIAAAGISGEPDGFLFRTTGRKTGVAGPMWQQDAYRMIQRQVLKAGLMTRAGNHTFRATGITAYLKNNGLLEHAQTIANHSSPRTTKLYDRRSDEISLDEVEKISI